MKILVTGAAGFIGFHLSRRFINDGHEVIGVDNLNDYYNVALKEARLAILTEMPHFRFVRLDISDRNGVEKLFAENKFDRVVHMAAQAGVRYSLENPHAYIQSNIVGFMNILEGCRKLSLQGVLATKQSQEFNTNFHLVFASSSSVYGMNSKMPFSVSDNVDHPISLYAATKKANELMAHTYSYLYKIPSTGLRFFTVYGPWGRPDMALFKFTESILSGNPIDVYGEGRMRRDFTYIDDIVEGVVRVTNRIPVGSSSVRLDASRGGPGVPYQLYNIGNNRPVELMEFISAIEKSLNKKAKMNYLPMQPGDVAATHADVDDLTRDVGFAPSTDIKTGVKNFVEWHETFYKELYL